jgi:hypothetical protein
MATKKKAVNGYRYTTCRGPIRHRWDAIGPIADRRRRTTFGTEATFRCENCGTIKIFILSRLTGDLISSPQYIHPDDYKTERHDSAYWRAMYFDEIDNSLMLDLEE